MSLPNARTDPSIKRLQKDITALQKTLATTVQINTHIFGGFIVYLLGEEDRNLGGQGEGDTAVEGWPPGTVAGERFTVAEHPATSVPGRHICG